MICLVDGLGFVAGCGVQNVAVWVTGSAAVTNESLQICFALKYLYN